ncbi:MAG: hypothetical protein KJ597_07395 [Nanoarchaeota archaeon]|nr:hypothetical protein [Nanoarchaeota archaeon]MBU1623369.1 hypothetical protein [Nanoarchaeota archaeon]
MAIENRCYVDGCNKSPRYIIEWYGVNQYGQNPEVADERAVCDQFSHLVNLSYHNRFGGVPDGIVDFDNWDKENPSLVKKVIDAMKW